MRKTPDVKALASRTMEQVKAKTLAKVPKMQLPRRRAREARKSDAAAPRGPVVVLIHGLAAPRLIMWRIKWLLERKYGRRTINIPYNSMIHDIPTIAEQIARRLAELNIREFDAVTHSMGGVLLRWAMNNQPMPRLRRAVLITPPNQGVWIAEYLHSKLGAAAPVIWGQAMLQLRRGDLGLAAEAGRLSGSEIGVIAGGSGTPKGLRNWFGIPGDNDGIVAVEETIMPGMKDFILLRENHMSVILSAQTAHMANLFLEHGVFRPRIKGELPVLEH